MPHYQAFIYDPKSKQVTSTKGPIEAASTKAAYDAFDKGDASESFYVRRVEPPATLATELAAVAADTKAMNKRHAADKAELEQEIAAAIAAGTKADYDALVSAKVNGSAKPLPHEPAKPKPRPRTVWAIQLVDADLRRLGKIVDALAECGVSVDSIRNAFNAAKRVSE